MIKTITKIGNSKGIILDAALLELAHLKEGDRLAVTVHEGGSITLTPLESRVIEGERAAELASEIIEKNDKLFRRLSK